jgi:hypothetical protein
VSALLVFAALVACAAACAARGDRPRVALIRGAVWWATLATLASEALGLRGLLGVGPIAGLWLVTTLAGALLAVRRAERVREAWRAALAGLRRVPVAAGLAALFLGATLVVALASVPNNFDSLTYHLPRVEHWVQNRTLAIYPANIEHQLSLNPGAEILLLQARLLAGDQRFANLLQWIAYALSAVAASLAAARLGAGDRGQAGAALFVLTLPMAVLQATSTQNDLTTGAWVLVSAERVLALRDRPSFVTAADVGAALGLVLVTKGSGMLAAFPVGCVLLVVLARLGPVRLISYGAVAGVLMLSLNAGWWSRNYARFKTPVGHIGQTVGNQRHDVDVVVANVIRNVGSQLLTPWDASNRAIHDAARTLVRAAGADPDDPASTLGKYEVEKMVAPWSRLVHEDLAADPLHMLLLAGVWGWAWRRRGARVGAAVLVAGALLYCVVLRWQLWGARLQVPFFLLGAPLVGLWLDTTRRWAATAVVVALAVGSLTPLLVNETRPLLPGMSPGHQSVLVRPASRVLFANLPAVEADYIAAASAIAAHRPAHVGLLMNEGSLEYAVWYLLQQRGVRPRLTHLRLAWVIPDPLGPAVPDMFLAIDHEPDLAALVTAYGPVVPVGRWGTVSLWRRAAFAPDR